MTARQCDTSAQQRLEQIHKEYDAMLRYLENVRCEIAQLQPNRIRAAYIPAARDELDAIVEATESATATILDAAEEIEEIAEGLGEAVGSDLADRARAVATTIYEASNFQDITGQRITKVVKTLHYLEQRIGDMARLFDHDESAPEPEGDHPDAPVARQDDLLSGPQLVETANGQDDIDALFADCN